MVKMESSDYDLNWKVIIIGDSGVGKTNLLSRMSHDKFNPDSEPTIGTDFGTSVHRYEGKTIKLQIWDTAGQEKYLSVTRLYFRGIVGALLVYDVTRKESFENLQKWMKTLKENSPYYTAMVVVGNKSDLVEERRVTADDVKQFTEQTGLHHMETSALNSSNVHEAFELLVDESMKKQKELGPVFNQQRMVAVEPERRRARKSACC